MFHMMSAHNEVIFIE